MLSPGIVLQRRYRIKRLLAHGGMGAVYEAEAVHLRNVIVAVKQTFFSEDRKFMREQFEREAATLARLRHPALPQVKDHFVEGGGQFLVMDYIAGDDLGAMLGKRMNEIGEPFEFRQVMEWAERLLDALVYIHSQYPPVIHRDIKPQNLKLTPQGELFLIDFGLSKDATTPTRKGHSVHAYTLEFAPPPLKHAVETEIGEREGREVEELKNLEEELRQRETSWRRKSKDAAPLPSLREEINSKEEDPANLRLVLPHSAPTELGFRETVANERRINQETSALEPTPAAPTVRRNNLRVAIGAIARNILIALFVYLLWNFILLAYLLCNIWIPANSTKDKAAGATLPIKVGAEPTPLPSPAPSYVVLPARIEMVYVPGGSFLMGSPESEANRRSAEGPQRHVTVPSFYIGKYEVTQAQWRAVMGGNPSRSKSDDLPVETVSWEDAKEFCRKLSQMAGEEYRLPTEAEWEYACRARTTGAFAGDLEEMAWYVKNSGARTHPVGQKQPNDFGLYDMHGNVREWCEDNWHNSYNSAPTDGSARVDISAISSARVFRGGGWYFHAILCRSADRSYGVPDFRNGYIGFRIVRAGG